MSGFHSNNFPLVLAETYNAPTPVEYKETRPSVFLAGSVEKGCRERWHLEMVRRLQHLPIAILDPWRDDWDSTWSERKSNAKFAAQVQWELDNLERVDVIALYLVPNTEAPISLLELGLFGRTKKVVVCCPDEFYLKGNVVEIVCERLGVPLVVTFEVFVKTVIDKLKPESS
ncbi:hypothetical protein C8Q74DRAFT_556148 [Fomes fomentarius]|nr:hypothetical protein C8Q74DRAFT_556148 [Fomes fomentarius]